jgi:hypothetical protein
MNTDRLSEVALSNLRATENDSWSYLCNSYESFGFFLWEWCEDWGIEGNDEVSARRFAESGEFGIAWLVHVATDAEQGVALFTGHAGNAPEDEPYLEGVFGTSEDAKAYLRESGVLAGHSP